MNDVYKKVYFKFEEYCSKPDKLLHATCRLTYSAVQHTVNYVQLSSTIELVAPYLQSINLRVRCSGKYAQSVQSQLLLSIKTFCVICPHSWYSWRRHFTYLIYEDSDFNYCEQ